MGKYNKSNIVFLFILILCGIFHISYSQQEAKYWYFGYHCGLKFENNQPIKLTDGALTSPIGSAVISDKNG
ncbi:MAG: hypothetical protein U9R42_07320, partial [Bacteroidota bacterium]|nr:hypothetical protein [Bacteroidota bacterium]